MTLLEIEVLYQGKCKPHLGKRYVYQRGQAKIKSGRSKEFWCNVSTVWLSFCKCACFTIFDQSLCCWSQFCSCFVYFLTTFTFKISNQLCPKFSQHAPSLCNKCDIKIILQRAWHHEWVIDVSPKHLHQLRSILYLSIAHHSIDISQEKMPWNMLLHNWLHTMVNSILHINIIWTSICHVWL